jgi:hypothetical protein
VYDRWAHSRWYPKEKLGGRQMRLCTCCDSQPSQEVVDNGPNNGFGLDFSREPAVETEEWHPNKDNYVQPIQMFMPVGQRPWLIDDVKFFFATRQCQLHALTMEGNSVGGDLTSAPSWLQRELHAV